MPDPAEDFYKTDFPDANWKDMKVPSHWVMEGFDSKTGTGGYRRHLQIPQIFAAAASSCYLTAYTAELKSGLNGKRIGSHEGGFSPFELDITNAAYIGETICWRSRSVRRLSLLTSTT